MPSSKGNGTTIRLHSLDFSIFFSAIEVPKPRFQALRVSLLAPGPPPPRPRESLLGMAGRGVFSPSSSGIFSDAQPVSDESSGVDRLNQGLSSAPGKAGKRRHACLPFAMIDSNVARGALDVRGVTVSREYGSSKRSRQNPSVRSRRALSGTHPRGVQHQHHLNINNNVTGTITQVWPPSNTPTPRSTPPAAKPPSKAETAEENFMNTINLGQLHGRQATLTSEGCGGAYLLQDKHGTRVGVWKPRNQEPFAPANPRGYVDASIRCGCRSPMRPSFRVGWGFLRERAVYTLDQASALQAGVPLTVSRLCQRLDRVVSSDALSPLPEAARSSSSKRLSRSPSMNPHDTADAAFISQPNPSASRAHHWCLAW